MAEEGFDKTGQDMRDSKYQEERQGLRCTEQNHLTWLEQGEGQGLGKAQAKIGKPLSLILVCEFPRPMVLPPLFVSLMIPPTYSLDSSQDRTRILAER